MLSNYQQNTYWFWRKWPKWNCLCEEKLPTTTKIMSYISFGIQTMGTNLKKHLAVEELVVAGDEIPPIVTVQLILLPGLGD